MHHTHHQWHGFATQPPLMPAQSEVITKLQVIIKIVSLHVTVNGDPVLSRRSRQACAHSLFH